ncbi:hypothetical protein BT93_L0093 [Corymbia citriodora subsp. variegata]|uniref:Endosomal/vacuolar adapter protein YPT35 n=1 Tax=Corymbia citriodora subsp. variegata TaxID=360336 RepID=A0A8T0CES4_CORYI|nr:hypothetical protein BT93_L0093 [Corymbia citriodora subsp. variegata]
MEGATLERQTTGTSSTERVKLNKRDSYLKSPPYWKRARSQTQSTIASLDKPPAISLHNNEDDFDESQQELWARSITISDHVVINGKTGIGDYVVWICLVEMLDGPSMTIRKRYSDFDELRKRLVVAFPESTRTSLPPLPPKSAIYRYKQRFLDKRKDGLIYFLNAVMLSPQYAGSSIVKDFVFAPESSTSKSSMTWPWSI